jgi:hypothetical protein
MAKTPASASRTWHELEAALATSLAFLPPDAYLVIEVRPPDDECGATSAPFVQLARERSALLAESGGGSPGRSWRRRWAGRVSWARVAAVTVGRLRSLPGATTPDDLRYQRFSRSGEGLPDPGLGLEPATPDACPLPVRPQAWSAAALDAVIDRALGSLDGASRVARAGPGEWTLRLRGTELRVVRVDSTPPVVRACAASVSHLVPDHDLLERLNTLNAGLLVGRVIWIEGSLLVAVEVPAIALDVDLVRFACVNVAAVSAGVAGDIGPDVRPLLGDAPGTPPVH